MNRGGFYWDGKDWKRGTGDEEHVKGVLICVSNGGLAFLNVGSGLRAYAEELYGNCADLWPIVRIERVLRQPDHGFEGLLRCKDAF